jgi:peptide/nickel transport system substrate-binding protein
MKRLLLALLMIVLVVGVVSAQAKNVKNPDTFVYASFGDVDSLDMAKAYDNVSWAALANIYDRLVEYQGTAVDKFRPGLASEIPTLANGGISKDGLTYTFKIRKGVKFHNGYALTPEDVAYSIQRNMVTDTEAGPDWIWFKAFWGTTGSRDDDGKLILKYADIQKAVSVKGDSVVFKLAKPFPPFLSVLAGKWASVVSKKWVAEQGGWDGTEAGMAAANNPATGKETLYDIANGTGPYKLVRWEKGVEYVLIRNDAYWGPKPALKNAVRKDVEEWSTRKLLLLQGDADCVEIAQSNYPEMESEKGITIYNNCNSFNLAGIHFNMKINVQDNPAAYSGALDGQGIPADLFSDKNVRLGFMSAWDEKTFIKEAMTGNALDPVTPFPKGMPFHNDKLESRGFDMKKAETYLKAAWGGKLWSQGFKMDLLYNSGNTSRELGMKMLAENLTSLNPKFQINVRAVEWANFLDLRKNRQLPLYFLGWSPDYPDADNYAFAYMHSDGDFAGRQGYSDAEADKLVMAAAVEVDPAKRQASYYRLQDIWQRDAIAILASQTIYKRHFKDWVKGYYYNPMESEQIDVLPFLSK